MNHKIRQCLLLETWNTTPVNNPVGRTPVKEGRNLPNSVTEDVGGISLQPAYSKKQLRRIERLGKKEAEYSQIKSLLTILNDGGGLQW